MYISKAMNINPDNVATPIAASLGDLVTLAILAYTSSTIHDLSSVDETWVNGISKIALLDLIKLREINLGSLSSIIILVLYYLAIAPGCFIKAKSNKETEPVLYGGWTPGNFLFYIDK